MAKTFAPTAGSRDNFNSLFERLSDCEAYLRLMYNELVHAEYDITFLTDRQQRQETEIGAVANAGAKNILKVTAISGSFYGLTRVVSDDGTITLTTGQAQNNPTLIGVSSELVIPKGNWILSGCPSGGSDSTYRMDVRISGASTVLATDTGDGGNLTLSDDTTCSVFIRVAYNYSVSNLVFKPMIRPASITDSTFQPYALPNPTLTPAAIKAVDEGAKQILKSTFTASTKQGVTATRNSDDTFTITGGFGTTHQTAYFTIGTITGKAGTVMVFPDGESNLYLYARNGNTEDWFTSSGGTPILTAVPIPAADVGETFDIAIMINNTNGTFDNRTFNKTVRVMICTAADWAVSQKFVPYCPTNRELYETCETKVTMQQVYGDAIEIPANSNLNNYNVPGIYYALIANVPTITNTPYNATGLRLVVEKNTPSGAAVFQTIYPTSNARLEFYRRVYEGGSWSSWYKFEGTAVT